MHDYVVVPDGYGQVLMINLLCPKHDVLLCSGIHDLENIHPWGALIGMCNWVAMTV